MKAQPAAGVDRRAALLACPTGSIGCLGGDAVRPVMDEFPLPVEGPVYYCGYNSPKSYGGNSYLVRQPAGHWLVDAPKFIGPLVRRLEALGGLAHVFLTHRDDVADADRYAAHFRARCVIHRAELPAQPGAEVVLDGRGPWELAPGLLAVATPGHTEGHCALLVHDRYLFTGDHLEWDWDRQRLAASEDYCWYSWREQAESMRRLADYPFEWVLPGHGQRVWLPAARMRAEVLRLADEMRGGER